MLAALSAGVVDLLTYTYAKRAEGGGFVNFDVPALFDELRAGQNSEAAEQSNAWLSRFKLVVI